MKLRCCVIQCTLWSDRHRLITKTFLAFRVLSKVGIDPNFPQKGLSLPYSERNFDFRGKRFKLSNAKHNQLPYNYGQTKVYELIEEILVLSNVLIKVELPP